MDNKIVAKHGIKAFDKILKRVSEGSKLVFFNDSIVVFQNFSNYSITEFLEKNSWIFQFGRTLNVNVIKSFLVTIEFRISVAIDSIC